MKYKTAILVIHKDKIINGFVTVLLILFLKNIAKNENAVEPYLFFHTISFKKLKELVQNAFLEPLPYYYQILKQKLLKNWKLEIKF